MSDPVWYPPWRTHGSGMARAAGAERRTRAGLRWGVASMTMGPGRSTSPAFAGRMVLSVRVAASLRLRLRRHVGGGGGSIHRSMPDSVSRGPGGARGRRPAVPDGGIWAGGWVLMVRVRRPAGGGLLFLGACVKPPYGIGFIYPIPLFCGKGQVPWFSVEGRWRRVRPRISG